MTHEILLSHQDFCDVITGKRHHTYTLSSARIKAGDQVCFLESAQRIPGKTGRKCWVAITFVDPPAHYLAIRGGYSVIAFHTPPETAIVNN